MNNDQKLNETLYDPNLLVKVSRNLNREAYDIEEDNLPFKGYDVWNGYEVTALTEKGLPVTGVMKIIIPADSKYYPESKSIEMYVNSFAMTKHGKTDQECLWWIGQTVQKDLSELLECPIKVAIFTRDEDEQNAINSLLTAGQCENLDDLVDINELEFTDYSMNPNLLEDDEDVNSLFVRSNKLRSECKDGTVYVYMNGEKVPTKESLLKFVVSFRNEYHYREEICEAIYKTLKDRYNPISLIVACNFTRRGGWDINPIRSNLENIIPSEWSTVWSMLKKTIKQ